MSKHLVANLLRKQSEGLNLYAVYIKLRFVLSLEELRDILSDESKYINVNGKYISRELEEISARIKFYVVYYKTKDIITLQSTVEPYSGDGHLTIDELKRDYAFINVNGKFKEVRSIPDNIISLLQEVNTIIPAHSFPEFKLRIVPVLGKWGEIILNNVFDEIDIKDESIVPTFYIDYPYKDSYLYLYPKYLAGKELLDYEELNKVKTGSFIRKNNTWRRASFGYREKFRPIIKYLDLMKDEHNENVYKLENFKFTVIEELEHANDEIKFVYSDNARKFIRSLKDFNSIDKSKLPDVLKKSFEKENIKLREYQKIGVNWLNYLRTTHLNGLIADDMGLGKTIQVIAVLAYAYEVIGQNVVKGNDLQYLKPSVVICPKSVVVVWKEQLSRFYPSIRTGIVMGKNRIDDYLKSATATNKIILITTYETVTYRKDAFLNYDYLYVILDEAQKIKNHQTQMSKTIKMLNATHKLAMTGTPIENHLTELWSIFDFIMRGYLGTIDTFKTRFQKPISEGNGTVSQILKKKIDPFKIRRTKKQRDAVTGQQIIKLPELIIDNIKIPLNSQQAKLYRKILNSKETKALKRRLEEGEKITTLSLNIFAIITRLKQICNHPMLLPPDLLSDLKVSSNIKSEKFESLKEKLSEIVESEQKVVIFSQYKEMLGIIEDYLKQSEIGYSKLIGGMSQKKREKNISQFQYDDQNRFPIFLASLKAGGVGISLTSASNVIHYDRWWNPAVENQATDRVYRSGNTSLIVNVYKFISTSTLEEKIDRLMTRKQALLDNIIQENKAGGLDNSFTREELIDLLSDFE